MKNQTQTAIICVALLIGCFTCLQIGVQLGVAQGREEALHVVQQGEEIKKLSWKDHQLTELPKWGGWQMVYEGRYGIPSLILTDARTGMEVGKVDSLGVYYKKGDYYYPANMQSMYKKFKK